MNIGGSVAATAPGGSQLAGADPGRRERKRLQTRAAVIAAAQELFAARGVDAVTIDEIANRADVAKGTVYNYFKDKESLVNELMVASRREITAEVLRLTQGIADPAECIVRGICAAFKFVMLRLDRLAALPVPQESIDRHAPINAHLTHLFTSALAQGRFHITSEEAGMLVVFGVITAGVKRATELSTLSEVVALSEALIPMLLLALGMRRAEADRLVRAAVADVFGPDPAGPDGAATPTRRAPQGKRD